MCLVLLWSMAGRRPALPLSGSGCYCATSMPIDRAVPAMIFSACSMSLALRSAIFFSAISRSCALLIEPTFSLCGTPEPFGTPAALMIRRAAGGVFRMNVNERSSYTLIWAGTMSPRLASVCALYALTNSMMFTPCWPSAGPTGGAGVAWPAGSCRVNVLTSFFFGGMGLLRLPGLEVCRKARRWSGRQAGRFRILEPSVPGSTRPFGRCSDLGDLVEVQLDRSLPAEDRHQDLELLLVGVDLADRGRERGERAVGDGDRVADLEVQ